MIKLGKKGNDKPSVLKDPFSQSCIHSVSTHCWKSAWGQIHFTGSVKFKNGNTQGEQKFEALDWPSLIQSMEEFIQQL